MNGLENDSRALNNRALLEIVRGATDKGVLLLKKPVCKVTKMRVSTWKNIQDMSNESKNARKLYKRTNPIMKNYNKYIFSVLFVILITSCTGIFEEPDCDHNGYVNFTCLMSTGKKTSTYPY